jgi:glycosyltransferase involved in cell wall biosynthesis
VKKTVVSFVASTFTVGGSERVLTHVITRLPRDRFRVNVYFLREPGRLGRPLFEAGIGGAERLQRNRYDPGAALRLALYLRRDPPDVLFVLDHHNAMLWGRIAALFSGMPRVVLASHATGLYGGRRNFRLADRWLLEFTDRVVALGRAHARYLTEVEGVAPGAVTVIENGIPVDDFSHIDAATRAALGRELGLGSSDRVVIMVAALRPEKAHEVLLEAARLLAASRGDLKFLVVGDGPRRSELERLRTRLDLDACVRFLGSRGDVARLLHLADVLVLPSHPVVETLPLAVLEAMAAGVPVVATRVGSLPEVIESGRTGVLIEPGNPQGLASALISVLDDPERSRAMAAAAREVVGSRYSVQPMVDKYAALFQSLAG